MSDTLKYGGPAFPTEPRGSVYGNKHDGMTLRDWFAGQALANSYTANDADPDKVAERAYQIANAMLLRKAGEDRG